MVESPTASPPARKTLGIRGDLLAVALAALLVGAAVAVGAYLNRPGSGVVIWAEAAPLYGSWLPHYGKGTVLAVLVAGCVLMWGPALAERLPWRRLLPLGYVASLAWIVSLALADGWTRGFARRLATPHEYLHEVPGITDIPAMLAGFSDRILAGQPDNWTTHVAGHPPGATLVFVWLDRLGLSGPVWAAIGCVLAGALVAAAVPVTLAALGRPGAARASLPFAVLFPGAVWLGVSADGLFAGVTAGGIALLALATRWFREGRAAALPAALGAGVFLGFGIFLSYGLLLLGTVALAVVLCGHSGRTKTLLVAAAGAAGVVAVFAVAGFWWLDGYHLVVERYYQGIASHRPYAYWAWANLACLVLAAGPAVVAGVRRLRGWGPVVALTGAALLAVTVADLSGLSKAEVERIWLPFAVWLLPATALLPPGTRRWWLAGQAALALAVNHLVLTVW
ncbi:hypothetical protein [Prauserella flavalba]|uniref:Integral membrane protein n=1 Tax=Prauserella flavalba TaxID=1477506 RepID=A0A318LAZ9_9PSEU|nr:hypothetical protein [Prauserella flavalba]PXY20000.1 hypothetical protein BA062_33965 [Prauserella flavalba]